MANVKNQAWLKGSWVCGKRVLPSAYSEMSIYTAMDCIGKQVRYAVSPMEHFTVGKTDEIIARLLAV